MSRRNGEKKRRKNGERNEKKDWREKGEEGMERERSIRNRENK